MFEATRIKMSKFETNLDLYDLDALDKFKTNFNL